MSKSEDLQEAVDKALDLANGYGLDGVHTEYLIKALARDKFGQYANMYLKKFNMKITDEDEDGIEQANKFLGDTFQQFLEEHGDDEIIEKLKRWKSRERKDI